MTDRFGSGGTGMRTLQVDRGYRRLDITGLTAVTEARRAARIAPGAVEELSASRVPA